MKIVAAFTFGSWDPSRRLRLAASFHIKQITPLRRTWDVHGGGSKKFELFFGQSAGRPAGWPAHGQPAGWPAGQLASGSYPILHMMNLPWIFAVTFGLSAHFKSISYGPSLNMVSTHVSLGTLLKDP